MSPEKWIVRKRERNGQLKKILTLTSKPSEEMCSNYGPGDYIIQQTVPRFTKGEKVTIKDPNGIKDHNIQLRPFNINKPQNLDKNKEQDQKTQNSLSEHDKNVEDIKKMMFEYEQKSVEKLKPVNVPKTEPLKKLMSNNNQIVIDPKTTESNIIKEDPNVIQPDPITEPKTHIKNTIQKKEIYCPRCLDKICDEDFLRYCKDEWRRCDYCEKFFHNKCYKGHKCPNSVICTNCRKRTSKESIVIADYCRKSYCSKRCENNCYEKNQFKSKCKGCKEEKEGTEEAEEEHDEYDTEDNDSDDEDDEDDSEEEFVCLYCREQIEDDSDETLLCDECEYPFCSQRCFKIYHKKIGKKKHHSFTAEDVMDLA